MAFIEPGAEVDAPPAVPVVQGIDPAVHAAVERELAVVRALPGADLSGALGQMFTNNYAGDMTAEAIRAEALAVGLIAAPSDDTDTQTPPATPEQLEQQRIRQEITAPGVVPPATPEELDANRDLRAEAWPEFQAAMREGMPREKAAAQVVDRFIAAAVKDAPGARVTYNDQQLATLATDGF